MAGVVITDATVFIGGTEMSDWVQSVEITETFEEKDTTNMSSAARRERAAGLADAQFSVTLFQSWATNEVNDVISPLVGTVAAVTVKKDSAVISTQNPEYQFSALITEWTHLSAAVGEVSMVTATWPISGAIVADVTP